MFPPRAAGSRRLQSEPVDGLTEIIRVHAPAESRGFRETEGRAAGPAVGVGGVEGGIVGDLEPGMLESFVESHAASGILLEQSFDEVRAWSKVTSVSLSRHDLERGLTSFTQANLKQHLPVKSFGKTLRYPLGDWLFRIFVER